MKTEETKVITCWDDKDNIKALVKVNNERKIKTISNFKWFFAVSKIDYKKIPNNVLNKYKKANVFYYSEEYEEYVKMYSNKSYNAKNTLDKFIIELKSIGVTPLESDLSLSKCWLHNNLIPIESNVDVLYFDIETDDTNRGIEIGRDKILSWAAVDMNGKEYFDSGDEKKILTSLIRLIHNYDAFVGWNSGNFDLPYIKARMKLHGLSYNWKKRIHVDLMSRLIKLFSSIMGLLNLPGFSLNDVSKTFLQKEKVNFDGKIIDLYKNDFETFKKYNIQDARLLYDLDQKISALPLMIKECEWTGTLLNKFYIGEILDNYILREAKRQKQFLISRPTDEEQNENLKLFVRGGFVMEPKVGLYENVRILDFRSLYPSIIVGWNIGYDSLNKELSEKGTKAFNEFLKNENCKIEDVSFQKIYDFLRIEKKRLDPEDKHYQAANNCFFSREHSSFIGDLVQNLLDQRKSYKSKLDELELDSDEFRNVRAQQEVVKEMSNCLHPSTKLYVKNIELDIREYITIEKLHNSKYSYEIESYNIDTGEIEWKNITAKMVKEYEGELLDFNFSNNSNLICTPEHKIYFLDNFFTINKKEAKKITNEDKVFFNTDDTNAFHFSMKRINRINKLSYDGLVYDIEVKDNHNFFVSNVLVSNSMFGITCDRRGRYFDLNIAEAITLTGQFLNKTLAAIAEKEGYAAVYGDTDSVFLVIHDEKNIYDIADKLNVKLKNFLDTKFKLKNNIVYAEYEKKYRKMIMLDKKRYTGNLTWMDGKDIDKIFTRGVETVKKNTIEYTRRRLNELIIMITRDDKTEKDVRRWLKEIKNEVLNGELVKEDIVIKTKITKPTYKYSSKPVHVKIAEKMIEEGKILQPKETKHAWGEPIFYIVTTTDPKMDAVHANDFNGVWDRRYYWDVQIYAPIQRILDVVWPGKNWEEHSIIHMEKIEKKKEAEEAKRVREEEREKKKKEREELKELKRKEKEEKQEEVKKRKAEMVRLREIKKAEMDAKKQERLKVTSKRKELRETNLKNKVLKKTDEEQLKLF